MLERFEVPHERHIVSAHRTPAWMAEFAAGPRRAGIEVIIAGAGGAAHLPGMVAAHTVLPVLGVPVQSAALQGLDSLLSIVQMPGGVPVGDAGDRQGGRDQRRPAGGGDSRQLPAGAADQAARVPRRADAEGPAGTAAVNGSRRSSGLAATLGVLGSGQLGRMFTIAARRMGYRVHTFSPDEDTPTGQVADVEVTASYEDLDALRAFARQRRRRDVRVRERADRSASTPSRSYAPVRPSGAGAAHRAAARRAKRRFSPTAASRRRRSPAPLTLDELWDAVRASARRRSIKTAAFGYDGKGQHKVDDAGGRRAHLDGASATRRRWSRQFISLQAELSVIAARGLDGEVGRIPGVREPPPQSHPRPDHRAGGDSAGRSARRASRDHPRDPRGAAVRRRAVRRVLPQHRRRAAGQRAGAAAAQLRAPDVRRGGTSQFEQQVRAICGLPLGSTDLLRPAAMANLLGDLWADGEPNWAAACRFTDVKLHLYGKAQARAGRKMGHLTAMARARCTKRRIA